MRNKVMVLALIAGFCLLAACKMPTPTPAGPAAVEPTAAQDLPTAALPTDVRPTNEPAAVTEAPTPAAATEAVTPTVETASAGYVLQVEKPDGSLVPMTSSDLKKLPKVRVSVQGKVSEGPTLLDVLKAAGVTDFKQITMTGADGYTLTIAKAQLNDKVILDFLPKEKVRLSALNIPKEDWVKEVVLIKVEN